MTTLLGPMLSLIEEAGVAVLTLTEGLEQSEFLGSFLTRREVKRQIATITLTVANLPTASLRRLPEIDWDGWTACALGLDQGGEAEDDALWFALRSLVPATLMWLRVYRSSQPELFSLMDGTAP